MDRPNRLVTVDRTQAMDRAFYDIRDAICIMPSDVLSVPNWGAQMCKPVRAVKTTAPRTGRRARTTTGSVTRGQQGRAPDRSPCAGVSPRQHGADLDWRDLHTVVGAAEGLGTMRHLSG